MSLFRKARAKAMALYCFIIRVYYYDNDTYERVKFILLELHSTTMQDLHNLFYKTYQEGFCSRNLKKKLRPTINLHVFSHLQKSRERNGPLCETSAEPFEALYSVIRRSCYRPGTPNTSKQILENYYLRDRYKCNTNVILM